MSSRIGWFLKIFENVKWPRTNVVKILALHIEIYLPQSKLKIEKILKIFKFFFWKILLKMSLILLFISRIISNDTFSTLLPFWGRPKKRYFSNILKSVKNNVFLVSFEKKAEMKNYRYWLFGVLITMVNTFLIVSD